jgi:hypothetical protein
MLIGDSFTWGAGAEPVTKSFSDLLRKDGLTVYNFGIPGTGPTQYKIIANKYVAILHPDYVMVFLYMGNDIKEGPDPAEPFKPLFHVTNAGWIWAWDEHGNFLDPKQAYEKYITGSGLRSKLRRLVYNNTVTGTLVWDLLRRTRDGATTLLSHEQDFGDGEFAYTFKTLAEIRSRAEHQGSQFLLVPIPNGGMACGTEIEHAFGRAPSYADFDVLKVDLDDRFFHPYPNCHLTNEGHARVYEAIMKWLQASMAR